MTSFTANVAGITFAIKDNPDLAHLEIKEGEEVSVIPEPENEFDSKALRLEYNGQKIGYVPRKKEGIDFSIQSWCRDHLKRLTATIEEVWYKSGEEITLSYSPEYELAGISIQFSIPENEASKDDKIITKSSFSEPDIIVDFNDTKHIYNMRCDDGYKVLKGGTTFIKRFYKPFDSSFISKQCAKSWGVEEQTIEDLWNSNGTLTAAFGTVVHEALEHYINYQKVGQKITKIRRKKGKPERENYAMPKHPFLRKTIKSLKRLTDKLDKEYGVEEVVAEALITDSKTGWGGLVDRLAILDSDKKIARVQDYKVNINAEKEEPYNKPLPPFSHLPANKLTKYALQMSFYAGILKKHGWTIEGLDVFIFEDKWVHRELDLIDFLILKK